MIVLTLTAYYGPQEQYSSFKANKEDTIKNISYF